VFNDPMPIARDESVKRPAAEPIADADPVQLQIPALHSRARRTRLWVALALLAAIGGGTAAYLRQAQPETEIFRSVEVTRQTIVRSIEATGHLDASERVEVSARVAGYLSELLVSPGDTVEAGAVLARLDGRVSELSVRSAGTALSATKFRLAEAQTNRASATRELERVERLLGRGLASEADLSAAQAAVERASAMLSAAGAEQSLARENVAAAKLGHNLGELIAPIRGVVLSAPEHSGIPVGPERGPLFVVASPLERMRIDADVSEADIGDLRVGQAATFEVQAYPGRRWSARVERIGLEPKRDGAVVTYSVVLRADNSERLLLPGMTAALRVEIAQAKDVLAVREAALRFTPEDAAPAAARSRVWLHEGVSELLEIEVTAGLSDGAYTEIRPKTPDALAPGARVAVGLVVGGGSSRAQPGVSLGNKR
jgi:HlyD family secretion protein